MKHFEDLWNKAEELSSKNNDELLDIIKSIIQNTKDLLFLEDTVEKNKTFGLILYDLCNISKIMNINSYAALNLIIEEIEKK